MPKFNQSTDLSDFHNLNQGSSAFVCGAGPSMAHLNLDGIHKHIVIAVNSACMLMPWQEPGDSTKRFWISNDVLCMRWTYFNKYVKDAHCTKVVRDCWLRYGSQHATNNFRYFRPRSDQDEEKIDGAEGGLCYVSSVPTSVDFAILMGCKSIFLLGVDHKMVQGNSHFWQFWKKTKPWQGGKKVIKKPEQSHQLRVFRKNIGVFEKLNVLAKEKGCKIYNCSRISTVEVFPKISLTQALEMAI